MKVLCLIILAFLHAVLVSAQTTQKSPALQEADRTSAEMVKLFRQGKYEEALPLAQKVIQLREAELGANHVSVAAGWRNLGYIQTQLNKDKDAEKSFRNAYAGYEMNQPLTANDEKNFVEVLEAVAGYEAYDKDIGGAEKKFLRLIELREKINGKEAPQTADALAKLGQIYQIKNDFEKAAPLLLRALDIRTAKTGQLDEVSQQTYRSVNCALSKLGLEEEKKKLQQKFYPNASSASSGNDANKPISGGVLNGKAVSMPAPIYPLEARRANAAGAVTVQVLIDETGKVVFACAIQGTKLLHRASEDAAYKVKFNPTTLNGKTVKVSGIVTYNYVL